MRSLLLLLIGFSLIAGLSSCTNLVKQLDMRAQAKHAKLSILSVSLAEIEFDKLTFFTSGPQLNFLDLNLAVEVKNDSDKDLIIDSFKINLALDETEALNIKHKHNLFVALKSTKKTNLRLRLNSVSLNELTKAKNLVVDGFVLVKFKIVEGFNSLPIKLPFSATINFAETKQKIKKEMQKMVKSAIPPLLI